MSKLSEHKSATNFWGMVCFIMLVSSLIIMYTLSVEITNYKKQLSECHEQVLDCAQEPTWAESNYAKRVWLPMNLTKENSSIWIYYSPENESFDDIRFVDSNGNVLEPEARNGN